MSESFTAKWLQACKAVRDNSAATIMHMLTMQAIRQQCVTSIVMEVVAHAAAKAGVKLSPGEALSVGCCADPNAASELISVRSQTG